MSQGFAEPGAEQCFRDHALAGSPIALSCAETPFGFNSNFLKSASGGGTLGYNFQFGGMILGLEADLSAKSGNSNANQPVPPVVNGGFGLACPGCFSTRTENFNGSVNQGTDSSFRLRFGYLVTPMTMVLQRPHTGSAPAIPPIFACRISPAVNFWTKSPEIRARPQMESWPNARGPRDARRAGVSILPDTPRPIFCVALWAQGLLGERKSSAIEFELRFVEGVREAGVWLGSEPLREELDMLCQRAKSRPKTPT
jgi:hypothetical protein